MAKPHEFPVLPQIKSDTQLYTQRQSDAAQPATYRFTIAQLADFLKSIGFVAPVHHVQSTASTAWVIQHNLGRALVGVTVMDNVGNIVEGAVVPIDDNNVRIEFSYAVSGEALIV